jgi:hypothetical protein
VKLVALIGLLAVLVAAAWPVDAHWKVDCNYAGAKSPAAMALFAKVTGDPPPVKYDAGGITDIFCEHGHGSLGLQSQ